MPLAQGSCRFYAERDCPSPCHWNSAAGSCSDEVQRSSGVLNGGPLSWIIIILVMAAFGLCVGGCVVMCCQRRRKADRLRREEASPMNSYASYSSYPEPQDDEAPLLDSEATSRSSGTCQPMTQEQKSWQEIAQVMHQQHPGQPAFDLRQVPTQGLPGLPGAQTNATGTQMALPPTQPGMLQPPYVMAPGRTAY